jgi:hypothetical protein
VIKIKIKNGQVLPFLIFVFDPHKERPKQFYAIFFFFGVGQQSNNRLSIHICGRLKQLIIGAAKEKLGLK